MGSFYAWDGNGAKKPTLLGILTMLRLRLGTGVFQCTRIHVRAVIRSWPVPRQNDDQLLNQQLGTTAVTLLKTEVRYS